ncbi:tetratricopeptide repeat-containing sensor histidine kinase [Aquimarina litoralis]|uniref:tetratricopeptide repeat-containing sensor histidine kinase n=1 Tax=Aquimarina litoralis TaxID=584605 RepID=UPI001C58BF78|nr:tetratricopeptide repeat-containing sensor histidine kinase [Aquimarina litoralis]MBW1294481.1 hypothetical protein [Aquimarina litoralis]
MNTFCRHIIYLAIFLSSCLSVIYGQNSVNNIWAQETIEGTEQLLKAQQFLDHLIAAKKNDSALFLSKKIIVAARKYKDSLILSDAFISQGEAYSEQNEYFYAGQSYKEAIKILKKLKDKKRLAVAYKNLYFLEYYSDNLTAAAEYLLESQTYYKEISDKNGIARVNNYLGDLYSKLEDFELAEQYYKKAIEQMKNIKGEKGIGLFMNNLSYLYINHKMPRKAKEIVDVALDINRNDSLPVYTIYSYYILAKIALHQKEYRISEKYYDTVLNIGAKTKNFALTIPLIISKQQMAKIALETKQYQKSADLLQHAREEFLALKDIDPTEHLIANYKIAAKLDSVQGNIYKVLAWQKRSQELSEKKRVKISAEKIQRAEKRHQAEIEHLKMIDENERKERESEVKLFRYKTFTVASIAILIAVLAFLMMIFKTRKDRKNLILELNQSNETKNKLFSIISHDLKNEILGLDGSLNLLKDNAISNQEFKEIIPLLANRTHQTSILLNNLLNWSKSQMKELNAKPVSFDINEVITDKFSFFEPKAEKKDIQLINKLAPTIIFADKDMFGIVAQNLIANAIKFCNPGDSIALVAKEKEDYYEICFEDTGVGIDPANLNKLFAEDTFTTKGTENETGTGLGLKICKELIELNQGKIQVESILGKGSVFCITLPKAA